MRSNGGWGVESREIIGFRVLETRAESRVEEGGDNVGRAGQARGHEVYEVKVVLIGGGIVFCELCRDRRARCIETISTLHEDEEEHEGMLRWIDVWVRCNEAIDDLYGCRAMGATHINEEVSKYDPIHRRFMADGCIEGFCHRGKYFTCKLVF